MGFKMWGNNFISGRGFVSRLYRFFLGPHIYLSDKKQKTIRNTGLVNKRLTPFLFPDSMLKYEYDANTQMYANDANREYANPEPL